MSKLTAEIKARRLIFKRMRSAQVWKASEMFSGVLVWSALVESGLIFPRSCAVVESFDRVQRKAS